MRKIFSVITFFSSIKTAIGLTMLVFLFLVSAATAAEYRYDIIGSTGQMGLTGLGIYPSINDNGTVAFTGRFSDNQGTLIGDGTADPRRINPGYKYRLYDDAVQINNLNQVLTSDRVPGNPPPTRIRIWDGNNIDSYSTVASGGGTFDSYDAVIGPVSLNNNGQKAFAALQGSSELLVTPASIGLNKEALRFPLKPVIDDTGHIVVKASDEIRLYNYDLSSYNTIAGTSNGFTTLGMRPGISDDGVIIVFAGDRGNGPGIFASINEGSSRTLQVIAGENAGPSLGNDSAGNPINFSSFDIDSKVAVTHQALGPPGIDNDSFVVIFVATPAAASPGNFTAQKGIWTIRVDAWTPVTGQYKINRPSRVVQVGDTSLPGNASVADFRIYDPIANAATDDAGRPRTQLRGEHRLAFWVSTSSGEMVVRATNSSDMPDLEVNSTDITISPTKVNVTIHNEGNAKADSVKVEITKELKEFNIDIDSEIKTIRNIPAAGNEKISLDWNLSEVEDVRVTVDPNNTIDEQDENNNKAETHKITGRITEEISGNSSLKYAKVEYKENSGADWETKYTTFTDDEGWYIIPLNNESISKGKEGRVDINLTFSPKRDLSKIKANFIPDSEWGPDDAPVAGAQPFSKSIIISNSIYKERDYPNKNVSFKPEEGGSVYLAFVNSYLYFKKPSFRYELNDVIDLEFDDKHHGSYYMSGVNVIHINATRLKAEQGYGKHSTAHEYGHRVSDTWGMPYGPGGPGDGTEEKGLDENWANFASTLARNDPSPHGSAGWNLSLDTHKTFTKNRTTFIYELQDITWENAWPWAMVDSWWELDKNPIKTPNKAAETLRLSHPNIVRAFYEDYRTRDLNRTNQSIKAIFRRHGYLTAGWPPPGPGDPDFFTGSFSDRKADINTDGAAEYLNIDVGLNITATGNYSVYGYLQDVRNKEYCFALSNAFLALGAQNVPLRFDGQCIFQNRLNGSYNLTEVYLADENKTEIDYRIGIYSTGAYDYREFAKPVAAFTGAYTDHGLDTDSDGSYNYLVIDSLVNVSSGGQYTLSGSLFDSAGNSIGDFNEIFTLNKGLQNVQIKFDGLTIHANRANGPYLVRGLSIFDSNEHIVFYDPEQYTTNGYDYSQFQTPEGSFTGSPTENAVDLDNDSLYDHLIVSSDLNISSDGIYSIVGRLTNSTGYGITVANNYSYLSKGIRTLSLDFNGEILRRSELDGPYNITLILYSNSSVIDKRTHVTSLYLYRQFQAAPEDYFSISFNDRGTDLDGNGLYDYLTVEANVSTDIKSGNYRFEGYLLNGNHELAGYASAASYVDGSPRTVSLNFSGQNIWKTHLPEGAYTLSLKVSDGNNAPIAVLDDAYVTSNYSYGEFEKPLITTVTYLRNTTYSETYINWVWTDPTNEDFSSVNVWVDGVFKTNVSKGVQYYNATGFSPDTEHTIAVRTVNNSGGISQTWVTHTARTAPLRIPPVILNMDPLQDTKFPTNTSSVQLSLQTDETSECRLSETTREFDAMSVFNMTNSLLHFTQVTNLENGKNYTFFINCQYRSGARNDTESFTFYIYNRTFLPPVLEPIPDITASENETVIIPVNATDPENDPLTITIQDRAMFGYVPIASRFTVENRTLKLRTNYDDAGKYYLRVTVSDGWDTVMRDFTLTVTNVNRPPVLEPIGNKTAIEGQFFSLQVSATDPDGDDVKFSDDTDLFNINPFNGMISFTPNYYQVGDHYVNISATDGEFTVHEVVRFHVTNINNPPVIEPMLPQKAIPGELFTLQVYASDPDNDTLAFSDDTDLFNISEQGLINFTPATGDQGKYLINITVIDGLANDTRILNLVVISTSLPPIITKIPDRITVYRNQSFDINVSACDPNSDAGCN